VTAPRLPFLVFIALLAIGPSASFAATAATSDALILLKPDGTGFTLQHTIASDGPLILLEVPSSAKLTQVSFLGPNQARHQENYESTSRRVQVWDGVALVRYQDAYTDELTKVGPHSYRLTLPSLPQNFAVENGSTTRSSFTWVLPENLELLSYSAVSDSVGQWQFEDNELRYEQTDPFAVNLSIEYKVNTGVGQSLNAEPVSSAEANAAFCFPTPDDPDRCAADQDNDSVPDYRDVCLPLIDDDARPTAADDGDTPPWHSLLGCKDGDNLVLHEVQFPSGYSYLDNDSRDALDRLAKAQFKSGQKTCGDSALLPAT